MISGSRTPVKCDWFKKQLSRVCVPIMYFIGSLIIFYGVEGEKLIGNSNAWPLKINCPGNAMNNFLPALQKNQD